MTEPPRHPVVLGAGPAGLAAGLSLARRGLQPVVLERSSQVGGICRTVEFQGYRFDLGGHRFFTKFDEVQALWEDVLGEEFLVRPRLSRILYQGKLFDYPLNAGNVLRNLGLRESARCGLSYARARLRPRGDERTFEEWVSNRFGNRLFDMFFRSYTEKVWGVPTHRIGAEWAAQRIKNLELSTAALDALRRSLGRPASGDVVTSLIEQFHYPRLGPGQMFDAMADRAVEAGADLRVENEVIGLIHEDHRVTGVRVRDGSGAESVIPCDAALSSIPLTVLVQILSPAAPDEVLEAARSLTYRHLLTVDLIIDRADLFDDTWIYVHDPSLKVGRIQNFGNWSPYMVPVPGTSALGLEYFCSDDDALWQMSTEELVAFATEEIARTDLLKGARVTAGTAFRVPRAYPVYLDGYAAKLSVIEGYVRSLVNVSPMGRYGLFKYNNRDHSILPALLTVENLCDGAGHDVWAVNTDTEYHEVRKGS